MLVKDILSLVSGKHTQFILDYRMTYHTVFVETDCCIHTMWLCVWSSHYATLLRPIRLGSDYDSPKYNSFLITNSQ